jgi:hypothetical protein
MIGFTVALLILLGIYVLLLISLYLNVSDFPGCTGHCEQGRKPCDCSGSHHAKDSE